MTARARGLSRFAAVALAAALALCGCARDAEERAIELIEPVGVRVDTEEVRRGDAYFVQVVDGVVASRVESLSFPVSGRIDRVGAFAGMRASAGDVLLTLDQTALNERVEELEAEIGFLLTTLDYEERIGEVELRLLELDLEEIRSRGDPLEAELQELEIERHRLSLRQRAQSVRQLELSGMEQELAMLTERMGKNSIVAPFDGTIVFGRRLKSGDWVSEYDPLLFLADEGELTIQCDYVTESAVRNAVTYARIGSKRYPLTYVPIDQADYVAAALAGLSVRTEFLIEIPPGLEGTISAGQYAAVVIESQRAEDVLVIPSNALQRDASGRYVYVIDENGARQRRDVKVGLNANWVTEIVEGLSEGERVYVKE